MKDRVGLRMIEDAERRGDLIPSRDVLVEATSGNTGIALCLAGAVKGYRTVIALPQKMSQEKLAAMVALGAEIIRTPTEAAWNDPDSHLTLAAQLEATIPHAHFLDQYINSANPQSHYDTTAEEILYQCDGKIEMMVMGAGTGGTVTGVGTKIKERCPNCTVRCRCCYHKNKAFSLLPISYAFLSLRSSKENVNAKTSNNTLCVILTSLRLLLWILEVQFLRAPIHKMTRIETVRILWKVLGTISYRQRYIMKSLMPGTLISKAGNVELSNLSIDF